METEMSAKRLKIEYGDSVFSLPKDSLLPTLASASGFDLKVLIIAASDDELRLDFDKASDEICRRLDCTKSALQKSLNFWNKAGVLNISECDGSTQDSTQKQKPRQKTLLSSEFPTYTESRTADVLASHLDLAGIIDACQQIAEKIFTPNEVQSIVAIYDYLGLNDEGYIVTLYQFCKRNGKTSPRYIEKVAVSLFDDGITTTSSLNEYIKKRDTVDSMTAKFRSLIGADSRKLTAKESTSVELWSSDWGYDIDVITRAYEITVERCGGYKLPYMGRILENWHDAGLAAIEDVDASLESYRKNKTDASGESEFEDNEYFEAALARSQRYLEEKNKKN